MFGPAYRDADRISCDSEADLPNERLQHEVACVALQSHRVVLKPGSSSAWTFVGFFEPNHADASSDADLAKVEFAQQAVGAFAACEVALSAPVRSIVQDAQPLTADVMSENEIAARYPVRSHEERRQGRLLSFFIPDRVHNRHVVLRDKEREVPRLCAWFDGSSRIALDEEVIGLGAYGFTLTILSSESLSEDPDQEEDEDAQLIEQWTPRFARKR